jgi:hypothetical protein
VLKKTYTCIVCFLPPDISCPVCGKTFERTFMQVDDILSTDVAEWIKGMHRSCKVQLLKLLAGVGDW